MEPDERELVRRCLAGDEEACARLVEAHARMVGSVIWRATGDGDAVEDLAQETFLRVFRALAVFDLRARLSTWIYTIAHRVAIDHLRKSGRRKEAPIPGRDDECGASGLDRLPASSDDGPEAALERAEADRLVQAGLARLPDIYRIPLVYAAIDALDYPEVAAILGVPLGTVKTRIFRGKRMLKERIEAALEARATAGRSGAPRAAAIRAAAGSPAADGEVSDAV